MNEFFVYLYFVIGNLCYIVEGLTTIIITCLGLYTALAWIVARNAGPDDAELVDSFKKGFRAIAKQKKPILIFLGVSIFLQVLYPTERQLKYIIGVYYLKELQEIKGVEKLPENTVNAINKFLKQLNEEQQK